MTDVNELTCHIRNLFLAVFSTNCALEGSEITQDEIDPREDDDSKRDAEIEGDRPPHHG